MQRHWSQTCIQHHTLGPFCREKSLSKIIHIDPAKKAEDEKKLCAEGTVTAVSIYETRNCISKRIQKFSSSRKLLTRICNKPHSIYMPLNWRALIKIILHSAGLCCAKKSSQPQTLLSQRSESPLLLSYPSQSASSFSPFFSPLQFTYLFCLFRFSSCSVSLLLFPYYSPFYLWTLFSFHLYICPQDWNLTVTQLSFCNDKEQSCRNSVLVKHLGEEFSYLQLCFAFYSCLLHSNWFKEDDTTLHHMAGKDSIILIQSCKELNQGVGSREGKKIRYSWRNMLQLKRNHLEVLAAKNFTYKSWAAGDFLKDDSLKICLIWTGKGLCLFVLEDPSGTLKPN